jgi:hypothetical protein
MDDNQIMVQSSENTKIQASAASSLNAGIIASVFGIKLAAMLEKQAEGVRVLVCPASENPRQSVLLKVICDSAGVSESVQASIDDVLKSYLGFTGGLEDTSIDVNQAFYYYSSYPADKGDSNQEYAFSLGMTNTYNPTKPDGAPFTVESISFSLWNSKRQKVIDAMGMADIGTALDRFT